MAAAAEQAESTFQEYRSGKSIRPLFLEGDALDVLHRLPSQSIDCCMTSPPYWGQRKYDGGGIGLEREYREYVARLVAVCGEVRRVLKPVGSFWLNIGDAYVDKNLLGLPWRVAFALTEQQGWILRNSVIWHKVKGGPDNAKDKLRNVHENVFHFVKMPHGYYYDVDAIRTKPREARVINGAVVSATGVSGVRYKRQIELSPALDAAEKKAALAALDEMLDEVQAGRLSDFRMIIRGQQRTTHSDSETVSGRARDLKEKGFYLLSWDQMVRVLDI
jgi:DNA modification methylase